MSAPVGPAWSWHGKRKNNSPSRIRRTLSALERRRRLAAVQRGKVRGAREGEMAVGHGRRALVAGVEFTLPAVWGLREVSEWKQE